VFNTACLFIAGLLAVRSVKRYRFIAWAVFLEFALHKIAYLYFFLEFRSENKWFIYLMYVSIQIPIMALLLYLKSHFVITALIFINVVYNLLTVQAYFHQEFTLFYNAKDAFIGTIMIFELIYLGLLNRYVHNYRNKYGELNFDFIDRVFRVRGWHFIRGMA